MADGIVQIGWMILQLALGSVLIVVSCVFAGLMWWALESILTKKAEWFARPPHGRRIAVAMGATLLWSIILLTLNVWLWALTLRVLGLFHGMEPAVYFALTSFTTLGFGDVLLPEGWRLLGGLAAANGLVTFGLVTALLFETLRATRGLQRGRGY